MLLNGNCGAVDNIPAGLEFGKVLSCDNGGILTAITTQTVHVGIVDAVHDTVIITVSPVEIITELLHVSPKGLSRTVQISDTVLKGALFLWIIILNDGFASISPICEGDEESPTKVATWIWCGTAQ